MKPAAIGPSPPSFAKPQPPFPLRELAATCEESQREARAHHHAHESHEYLAAAKLAGKVALISGGASGIGRAVAVLFAREGADVAILHLTHDAAADADANANADADAEETKRAVEKVGARCLLVEGDVGEPEHCRRAVEATIAELGQLDIVVSNAAIEQRVDDLHDLSIEQIERTFRTNILGYMFLTKAALPHLAPGAAIIATGSEAGIHGDPRLLDYAATKGAIHAYTRSLAAALADRHIRVNCVAPGGAQPDEVAPAYVFLASNADSSFVTGQVLPALGGVSG